MTSLRLFATATVLLALATVARAGLGPYDHVKCYKVRDTAARTSYTADLFPWESPFPVDSDCVVKVPATMLCSGVASFDVQPPPPGASPGVSVGSQLFTCYKVKCPKVPATVTVADQFGTRDMTFSTPRILCAPARVPTSGSCESSEAPTCGGSCEQGCFCTPHNGGCACYC